MPSTVFFIIALWAFSKSSPRLEHWLLSNRIFGPALRQWRETRTMSARAKAFALGGVWLGIGTSMILLSSKPVAVGSLALTAICLTVYLASIRVS